MKTLLFLTLVCCGFFLNAQEIIKLPNTETPPVTWETAENEYFSNIWNTQVVTNVSEPTMQVFRPKDEINNGTSVIVAPGGGLFALSINSEGNDVAKWLNEKGITAFVLKYRLVPTGEDAVAEIENDASKEPEKFMERVTTVLPYSIKDGLNAVKHVRENADTYGINPNKIGFMGFSAGGAVTVGVGYNYTEESKPNFLVPVYYWSSVVPLEKPKEDAPPMFLVCASDDPLGLAPGTIALYSSWHEAGKTVALHMYSKGGHGFGMRKQGLPSDSWIERFYDWSKTQDLVSDY
jgi:acetyl esterase/lipase